MSSSALATKVAAARGSNDAGTVQQSTIYKGIMTPIIFISFLLSLVWVDIRYTIRRSRNHGHNHGGVWTPGWLHTIVYRRSPYQQLTPSPKDEQGDFYYHSKQKRLMHMEVDDAFEVRGQVLVALGLFSLAIFWGVWVLSSWLWRNVAARPMS